MSFSCSKWNKFYKEEKILKGQMRPATRGVYKIIDEQMENIFAKFMENMINLAQDFYVKFLSKMNLNLFLF